MWMEESSQVVSLRVVLSDEYTNVYVNQCYEWLEGWSCMLMKFSRVGDRRTQEFVESSH